MVKATTNQPFITFVCTSLKNDVYEFSISVIKRYILASLLYWCCLE